MKTSADEWTNIPLNVFPKRGLTSGRKYLSTTLDGKKVDLYNKDDQSGRQQWILTKKTDGSFYIKIYSGVSTTRQFLSTSKDGTKVDLYDKDDRSGRQKWVLRSLDSDLFNILNFGGVSNDRKYLSCTADGKTVDLWTKDDGTGRQRWKIESAGSFEFVGISYSTTTEDQITELADFECETQVNNGSSVQQQMTVHFSKKTTISSNFTQNYGISVKLGAAVKVGVPCISGGEIQTEVVTSGSWTFNASVTIEDTQSYDFTLDVPANTVLIAKIIISKNQFSANYDASIRNKINDAEKKIGGKWRGTQISKVEYNVIDPKTGEILKKWNRIPAKRSVIRL